MTDLWTTADIDGVRTLTFDNPPRNFLTFQALAQLGEEVARAEADAHVKVIVLASANTARFISHADLAELTALADGPVADARHWYSTFRAIERCGLPVLAAVDGQCWGGGVELLCCCTSRIGSERATFSLPEAALGMIPGAGGTQRLWRIVGPGRAADMILSSRVVAAVEAERIGLIDLLLPTDGFATSVAAHAAGIARQHRDVIVAATASWREAVGTPTTDGLRGEGARFAALIATEPCRATVRAAMDRYRDSDDLADVSLDDLGGHP